MKRESAFRPKTQEVERTVRSEAQEKIEEPLLSLEKDKSQVSGFNFTLSAVLDGRITDERQLRAFVQPKFQRSGSFDYLRTADNSDFLRLANGDVVSRDTFGGGAIHSAILKIGASLVK